jgi:hypothetical protein
LASQTVVRAPERIVHVGLSLGSAQSDLGRGRSDADQGVLDQGPMQPGSKLAGKEGRLVVAALSLPGSVEGNRDDGVDLHVGGDQSCPTVGHQLAQRSSQGLQILVLELMDGTAQETGVKGVGPEPIKLQWCLFAPPARGP